jgi:hypothetical protein
MGRSVEENSSAADGLEAVLLLSGGVLNNAVRRAVLMCRPKSP